MATNHNFRIKNGLHVQGGTATFHSVSNNSDLVIGGVIAGHDSGDPARITTSSTGHLYLDSTSGKDLYLNWWNSSSTNIITESKIRAPALYDRNDTSYYVNPASGSLLNNLSMVGTSTYLPAHAYTHTHDGTNVYWHVGSASGSTNKVLNLRVYKSDNTNYTIHQFLTTGANITGNLNVTGNLSVTGTIDRNNVTDLDVVDKTITVGVGQTEANSGDSGLIVAGSAASMLWNETSDRFDFNKKIYSASNIAAGGNLSGSGVYSSNNFYSLNTAGSGWDLVIGRNGGVPYADMKHSYRINGTTVIDSSRNIAANTSVTVGNNTTAGILRAHYNDASYMTLTGYGLEMNRTSSYIRPTSTNSSALYIGGADSSLNWNSINFRATNGLYMSGTKFLDASRNLTNIGNITASGNLIMENTTSRIELGTYLKFYGAAHSNTAALAVNANYDGGSSDSWTPDYAGASSSGMFLLRESSGGGGTMSAWVKNHGTTGGSHARSTFTEVARFDQAGYFFGHNIRTELMYDVNNTNYYVNPASNTVLNTASIGTTSAPTSGYGLRVASIQMHGAGSLDYISQLHFADNLRFYDEGNDSYLNFKWGDTAGGGIQFFNGSNVRQGVVYGDNGNFGLLSSDASWAVNATNAKTQIYHRLDTPIMYDMDNTDYYVNPASTSKLSILNTGIFQVDDKKLLDLPSNSTDRGPWNPIASSIRGSGRRIYNDEEFQTGNNSINVYNNAGGNAVVVSRVTASSESLVAPNGSGYVIKVAYASSNSAGSSPAFGGIYQTISSEENHTFVQLFQAKIPVGRTIVLAENAQGTNNTSYFLTNQAGTGKWEWYVRVSHCGDSGTFHGGGHLYISGGSNVDFDWYLASCEIFDVTEAWQTSNYQLKGTESVRSPVFYDLDNTTYFVNPNNTTTSLNALGKINGADIHIKSGTSGTNTQGLLFTLTDNTDAQAYIKKSAYYMHYNAHYNEGHRFTVNGSDDLLRMHGSNNGTRPDSIDILAANGLYMNNSQVINSTRQIFAKTGTQVGEDGTYGGYGVIGFGGITNGYNRVFGRDDNADGLYLAAATGRKVHVRSNGAASDHLTLGADGTYSSGYSAIGFGSSVANGSNRVFASTSTADGLFLASATGRHIYFRTNGSGANTFVMTSGGDLQAGSTTVISNSGHMYSPTYYDSDDTGYYVNPASSNSKIVGLNIHAGSNNNTNDASLYINKTSNADWGLTVQGTGSGTEYGVKVDLAGTHSYAYRAMNSSSEYSRLGTDLFYHNNNIRAPIFYDYNNTSYYIDPNNSSISARFDGKLQFNRSAGTSYDFSVQIGAYNHPTAGYTSNTDKHWVGLESKGGTHIILNTDGGDSATENAMDHFTVWQGGIDSTVKKKFWVTNIGNTYAKTSMRAPIFYDSDDSAFYTNPAATSIFSTVKTIALAPKVAQIDYTGVDNGTFSFTNPSGGSANYTNRGGRVLTSNASGWHQDGEDPTISIVDSHTGTDINSAGIGLYMHNEQNTNSAYSPGILFGAKSTSNSYNSMYGAIYGRKTTNNTGVDTNWNSGELHFFSVGSGYVTSTPDLRLSNHGEVHVRSSVRAPIFYDSDNTGYYANLAGAGDSIRTAGTVHIGPSGHLGLGNLSDSKLAIPGENAAWSGSGTTTGQVVIDLPGDLGNYDMMYLEIDVYEYSEYAGSKIIVGAHNWNSGANSGTSNTMWHNVGVQIVGRFNKEIFFGWRNNGSVNKRVIVLGSTTSSWSYGTVRVSSVSGATDFYNNSIDYTGDWNVTQSTSGSYYTKSPTTNFNDTDKRVVRVHRAMQAQRMYGDSDMRAPVFYDLNDTTYRADPASNSVFNTMDITQIDVANAGMISFYGNGSRDHSISSYLDDDIRINSYGAMYINLDSNGNNSSAADFKVIQHAGTGTWAASQELFKVDGETGRATVKDGVQLTAHNHLIYTGNANNLKVKVGGSGGAGIALADSTNAFRAQLYGDASGYGFLASEWGAWDIKKVGAGRLYTNNTTDYYLQPNSNSKFQWLNVNAGNEAPGGANSSVDGLVLRSGVSSYNTTTTTWGHKFHKKDHGGGVPLYLSGTIGSAAWAAQQRWGTYTGNGYTSQIFGSLKVDTSVTTPIFYDSDDTAYYLTPASTGQAALKMQGGVNIKSGHGSGDIYLHYDYNGTDTYKGSMLMFASEPGVTHDGGGIGTNINISTPYYGRAVNHGYGIYLRFNKTGGQFEFWNTQGTAGTANGRGTMRFWGDAVGNTSSQTSSRAPIFYDSDDTGWFVNPAASGATAGGVSGKFRNTVIVGDGSNNVNSGTWGARLNITDSAHSKIEVDQSTNGVKGMWYAHSGQQYVSFGTSTAHPLYLKRNEAVQLVIDDGYVNANNQFRAPIFYDNANTARYVDPNGGSIIHSLSINDSALTVYEDTNLAVSGNGHGVFVHYNGSTAYRGYWDWRTLHFGNNGSNNILFGNTSTGGYGNFYVNSTAISQGGSTSGTLAMQLDSAGNVFSFVTHRAPIYYDLNNTNYYADPASTSVFHKIKADTIYGFTKNYASSELWAVTTSDSNQPAPYGGVFSNNGEINTVEWGETPRIGTNVRRGKIWKTRNNDSSSNDDGGWNKSVTGLDVNKAYMSVVYVKRASSSTNGAFYHGCDSNSTNTHNLNNTGNSNPYFSSFGIGTLEQDEWYVSVGIIQAANDTNTSNWTIGGLWKLSEGVRKQGYTTYKMGPTGNGHQNHRTYLYYSTDANAALDWYAPGFYEINGSEPSIEDLLGRPIEGSLASLTSDAINITASISNDTDNSGSVNSSDALNMAKGQRGTAAGMRTPSIGVEGGGAGIYLRKKSALEEAVGIAGSGEIVITGGAESGNTETTHHKHATTWSYGQIINYISTTGGFVRTYYTGSSSSTDAVALTSIDVSGNFIAKGNVTAYGTVSDIRLKENIEVIPNALEKVQKLRGVTFNYKEDNNRSTGLIAQELQEVLPEVVYETENIDTQEKHYAVRYGNITGLLVEAMKEQSDQINAQQKQINELTSLIKTLLDK